MARYLLFNYFSGACGIVRSTLAHLAARGWRNIDSTAGSLGSRSGSSSQIRISAFWQSHTNSETGIEAKRREASEERAKWRNKSQRIDSNGSTLLLLEPLVKGEVMTGKRRAVARILLLYWATVAIAIPCQALGPETVEIAYPLRHASVLLT